MRAHVQCSGGYHEVGLGPGAGWSGAALGVGREHRRRRVDGLVGRMCMTAGQPGEGEQAHRPGRQRAPSRCAAAAGTERSPSPARRRSTRRFWSFGACWPPSARRSRPTSCALSPPAPARPWASGAARGGWQGGAWERQVERGAWLLQLLAAAGKPACPGAAQPAPTPLTRPCCRLQVPGVRAGDSGEGDTAAGSAPCCAAGASRRWAAPPSCASRAAGGQHAGRECHRAPAHRRHLHERVSGWLPLDRRTTYRLVRVSCAR